MQMQTKLYYSISEVSEITGLEAYTLRYWEKEFPKLKPKKSRKGQRTYTQKDIDTIMSIKQLLYDQKFTIKGAREKLKKGKLDKLSPEPLPVKEKATKEPVSVKITAREDMSEIISDIKDIKIGIQSLLKEN
ncbi:MAG: MerR family transcriptional regulator [Candidatus Aureabacteria bacterium]|nr:MerR family transcriptional regulator [Candidatus Auribacterota bacterium]